MLNNIAMKEFVENNPQLATCRQSKTHSDLYVLKYKKRVFFDNLWNDYLELCRGTVVDADYNIVSKPFRKIYNYGIENRAPVLDDSVQVDAYVKINGFMGAITWYKDDILISTTGSLDSDFVQYVKDHVTDDIVQVCKQNPNLTFMFECVHKEDPHIIPEAEGLYLLGYNNKQWDCDERIDPTQLFQFASSMQCKVPEYVRTTVRELKKLAKTTKTEGYVAYTDNGEAFKIKSPYYLLKKLLARTNNLSKLANPSIKEMMPEEFYPLVDEIQKDPEKFIEMKEQSRLTWIRNFLENINA